MRNGLAKWLGLACLLAPAVGAGAQATLVADAHVSSARPTVNAGSLTNLNVGGGYTALLQFDLSMLPPGTTASQVTRAILRVYCNREDAPGLVAVQPVGAPWAEYTVTYAAMPVLGTAVQTAQVSAADTFVTFDVTATVQGWVTAPASNNGLALSSSAAVLQFDSKENDETAHAPELQIVLAAGGAGTPGPVGAQGPAGVQGVAGLQGPQGIQGVPGQAGVPGPQGSAGVAGPKGATGASGPAGPQGVAGVSGAGVPGPAGPAGPEGQAGAAGLQGPQGLPGADGVPGVAGAKGLPGLVYQGVYASTSNYALGDVVLFGGASYASLVDSNHGQTPGLSPAYWGVLTAQGPQGIQGIAGSVGAAGPQGLPGSVGPPGERGDQGLQGIAGQAGAQGLTGATGADGLSGPMGPQGVAGPVGMAFRGTYDSTANYALADGVSYRGAGYVSLAAANHGNTPDQSPEFWAVFATGTQGAAGAAGVPGEVGATGPAGPQGVAGSAGATGTVGPQGPAGVNVLGNYSPVTSYTVGDAVSFAGSTYVSVVVNNHGNTPGLSPDDWAVLASQGQPGVTGAAGPQGVAGPAGAAGAAGATGPQGPPVDFAGAWSESRSYAVGDAVSFGGGSYIAIAANVGSKPDASPQLWGVLASAGVPGPVGATGLQGPAGAQGEVGPPGQAGAAGQAGAQGVAGVQGVQGPVGPTGSPGVPGPQGLVFRGAYVAGTNYAAEDAVSFDGASYISLVTGNAGQTPGLSPSSWGLLAMAGAPGTNGAAGATGPAGPQGLEGPAGVAGVAGPAGPPGVAGSAGAPGPQGVPGAQGPAGGIGLTGATGPPGAAGADGAEGVPGPPVAFGGEWSISRNYAVGDAVSFAGGSYIAVAANVGREPDVSPLYWGVLAAAGATGPAGPQGATGFQGPTGASGAIGPQGLPGSPGTAGSSGPQGLAGATGPAGPQGEAGAPGPAGGTGPTGAAGPAGAAGAPGALGAPGPAGPQGATGLPGPSGSAGAVGMNFRGPWTQGSNYSANDAVTYEGSTYLAETASLNRQPDGAPGIWTIVAQAGGAGPTGAAGVPGAAATVAVGTVTTLAAGAQATVSNGGTPAAAVLNFGIPQGAAGAGGSGGTAGGGSFAAMYHAVSFSTAFYAVNAPTAAAGETAAVLAWVPKGCSAVRLDVFSQQSNTVTVTLRNGAPGTMADTALSCAAASGSSCTAAGAVTISSGSFIDLSITGASGNPSGVWTKLECD